MRETDRYMLPEGKFMQQPVFAPRADSKDEDDGYLIAYVGDKKETEVYIWDAKKVSEGPIARVQLPQWVPFGSHAYWGRGSDIREAQERNQRNKTAP
jgi:carotenoid cleavage dioxygenase-like enzyme